MTLFENAEIIASYRRSEAIAETFHETGNRIDCEGSLGKPRWLG